MKWTSYFSVLEAATFVSEINLLYNWVLYEICLVVGDILLTFEVIDI